MKIAILSTFIENYRDPASFKIRLKTAQKMAERGHEVIFISPALNSKRMIYRQANPNLRIIATPGILPKRLRVGGFSLLDALCKTRIVLEANVDVIQVTNGHRPAQLLPCLAGKYLKNAVIVDECWEWLGKRGYAGKRKGAVGKIVSLYDRIFELKFKSFYDHIITISTALKDRFQKKDNVTVLFGGTENDAFKDYEIQKARTKLGIPLGSFIVGMSNITPSDHEDNNIFFSAFEKLTREYNNLFLLVTGPDYHYIQQIKESYTLGERLIFPGWVEFETYNNYLSACDVFVLPYSNTPINAGRWPNKIGDYLCLNRPIITNPTGDVKDLFVKHKIGLLCEETSESFYGIIKKILDGETELALCNENSRYVATKVLSFNNRVERLLEIFETEIKQKRVLYS